MHLKVLLQFVQATTCLCTLRGYLKQLPTLGPVAAVFSGSSKMQLKTTSFRAWVGSLMKLQAKYMLCWCKHCFWVTLLLCFTKCLPSVHIAASVYSCQDLRSIIIKTTSYIDPHVHIHSESFCCCCCPLKATQKLTGGRYSMWEMQYLQKRKGKNKALWNGVRHFHTFIVDQCYVWWCDLSEYMANDNHCFLLIRLQI